jgi:predicted enzyme related to lactoylglutathione lyase
VRRRRGTIGVVTADAGESEVFRPAGISYLRIPSPDPKRSGAFYEAVFGWLVDLGRDDPSFEDGTGHVIGHIHADMEVAGDAGVRPYVYVEGIEDTLRKVEANGGELVTAPYPEGDLTVAVFRDPTGNVIGVWERANRR